MNDSAHVSTDAQAARRPRVTRMRVAQLRDQRAREPLRSERSFARDNGIPRSTLRGLLAANDNDDNDPVAVFLRTEHGARFLHRILLALIVVFVVSGAGSLRQIEAFLRLVGLQDFIAPSPSSLNKVRARVEAEVLRFDEQQRASVAPSMKDRALHLVLDETFHDQPILVAMDARTGFLLTERRSETVDSAAWNAAISPVLSAWPGVQVHNVIADGGAAIDAYARSYLQRDVDPDVMHPQQELARAAQPTINALARAAQSRLDRAQEAVATLAKRVETYWQSKRSVGRPPDWMARTQQADAELEAAREEYTAAQADRLFMRGALHTLSGMYHPYELATGAKRTANSLIESLCWMFGRVSERLEQMGAKGSVGVAISRLRDRMLESMPRAISLYHVAVEAELSRRSVCESIACLLREKLIAAVYIERAAARRERASDRAALLRHARRIRDELSQNATWQSLSASEKATYEQIAMACVSHFEPCSAMVEGRNGWLRLRGHQLHRVSDAQLSALTAVHNYMLRRSDGSSAAERLFERQVPDLFEHLVAVMPEPPHPRRMRQSARS